VRDAEFKDAVRELTRRYRRLSPAKRTELVKVLHQVSLFIDTIGNKPPPRSKRRKSPVPELKPVQLSAIARRARRFQWEDRGDDPRNVIEWTRDHYGRWIPGLLRTQLFAVDAPLYRALQCRMRRPGYPDWLDLPTKTENLDRNFAANPKMRGAANRERLLSRRAYVVAGALRRLEKA
jgi:hypothetical protein